MSSPAKHAGLMEGGAFKHRGLACSAVSNHILRPDDAASLAGPPEEALRHESGV